MNNEMTTLFVFLNSYTLQRAEEYCEICHMDISDFIQRLLCEALKNHEPKEEQETLEIPPAVDPLALKLQHIVDKLFDHFDTIQILTTRDNGNGTDYWNVGKGLRFARAFHAQAFGNAELERLKERWKNYPSP